jgi:hypothetical protein
MTEPPRTPITALVQRLLPRLRYPYLFLILAGLFLVDLVVPDPVPLVDELLLAILTFVAASLTTRKDEVQPPRDVTPSDEADRLSAGGPPESSSDGDGPSQPPPERA